MSSTEQTPANRNPRADWAQSWIGRFALGVLVGNVLIVVTGGLVRLTDSGLGCPTWPRCTDESYTNTAEQGIHGYVEFGNRLLTFGLSAAIVAAVVAAWLLRGTRPRLLRLASLQLIGVLGQATLGGITVLTGLNPWTVSAHFLVSMVLIAAAYRLWIAATGPAVTQQGGWQPSRPWRQLAWGLMIVSFGVITLGTVVTGSGPHSGDADAPRTGFDPETISQVHADAVFLLIGLTIGCWFAARAAGASSVVRRATTLLLALELSQGVVGFVQYTTGLPVLAVTLHLLGASLTWLATVHCVSTMARRPAAPPAATMPGPTLRPRSAEPEPVR